MTYCSNCIHYKVCGNEGVDDSAMTFCADKMTNEEAISYLKWIRPIKPYSLDKKKVQEAIDMAIMAIKALKQTDGDSISRDYTIKQIRKAKESNYNFNYDTLIDFIKVLPSTEKADGDLISLSEKLHTIESTDGQEYYQAYDVLRTIKEYMKTAEVRPMQVELEADGYADGELVYDFGKCPNCGWEFEEGDKDWEEPYCCHCGQKLKWFEIEEKE